MSNSGPEDFSMLNLATFGLGVSAAAGLAEVWLEAAEPTAPAEAAAAFWPDRATTSSGGAAYPPLLGCYSRETKCAATE